MARQRKRSGLAIQPGKGYKASIGIHAGRDGKLKPKTFYLGFDAKQAENLKLQIKLIWRRIELKTAEGSRAVWGETELHEVECLKAGLTPDAVLRDEKSIMAYDAMDKYAAYVRQRYESGKIRKGRMTVCTEKVPLLKRFIPNVPLKTFGHDELMKLTATIASRPIGEHGQKLSAAYAAHLLREAKLFFQWADGSDFWEAPRRFYVDKELLRASEGSLTTETEREEQAKRKVHFTLNELVSVYGSVSRWYQMLICLSMNTGFGPMEIATLRHSQVHLDVAEPYIERLRGKTNQPSCWTLWPETVELIREFMVPPDRLDGFMFEARQRGGSLIDHTGKATRITHTWYQYVRLKNIQPALSFKCFRKTSAQMIRDIAGVMAGEMQLSHAAGKRFREELDSAYNATPEDKTAAAYHAPGYQHLHDAIRRLRERLEPMFAGTMPTMRLAV